jgi:hypothetical protein
MTPRRTYTSPVRRRRGVDLHQRDCAGNRVPAPRLAHCVSILVTVLALAWPASAFAVLPTGVTGVDAPGLQSGPFITAAGVVWESEDGIMLTNREGRSKVLAPPGARNWEGSVDLAWFGSDWWALARPSGVFGGRIGSGLRRLPLLRKCTLASPKIEPGLFHVHYAVSGEHLYAALPKPCLPGRHRPQGELVDIDLRSGRWRVLARTPLTPEYMAASAKYIALAYSRSKPRGASAGPLSVRVLDAATGALAYQVAPPPSSPELPEPNMVSGIQIDDRGDVLVAARETPRAPGELAHSAQPAPERSVYWWATMGAKNGHDVQLGKAAVLSLGKAAVLSDGRVAFFSTGGEAIDVKDLHTGTTRTLVRFAGSVSADGEADGLSLGGNELAWVQQSSVLQVTRTQFGETCTPVPLSPVEIASVDLRRMPSSPVVINGAPIPPQYANEPVCNEV